MRTMRGGFDTDLFRDSGDVRRRTALTARTYVGRLERGERGVTVEALAAICVALGVSLSCSLLPRRFSAMHLTSHGRSRRRFQRVYRPLPY